MKIISPTKTENRRTVFWALTVITAIFTIADILSDIVLRSNTFHGQGESAFSWDVVFSILLIVWAWMARQLWKDNG